MKSKFFFLFLLATNIACAKNNVYLGLYNLGPKSYNHNQKVDTTQGRLALNERTFSVTYILNIKQDDNSWQKGIIKTYRGNWRVVKDVHVIDKFKSNRLIYNKLKKGEAFLWEFVFNDGNRTYAIFTKEDNYPEIHLQQNKKFFIALNDNSCNTFIHKLK